MYLKILIILLIINYINGDYLNKPLVNKPKQNDIVYNQKPNIYFVHYLFKNDEKNKYEISSIGLKNLKIEYKHPENKAWLVKSIWTESYNKTG